MAVRSVLATLLCASVVAACSGTPATVPLRATCDQFRATPTVQQSVATTVGTDIEIVLCANPSTGFAWEEPQIADAAIIRLVDSSYQVPDGASSPIVGAAGSETLTIHTLAAGSTTLSTRYSQPWDGGTKGEWTYRLSVTVR